MIKNPKQLQYFYVQKRGLLFGAQYERDSFRVCVWDWTECILGTLFVSLFFGGVKCHFIHII